MTQQAFERLCTAIFGRQTGKRTRTDLYVHRSVVEEVCAAEVEQLDEVWIDHAEALDRWNVLRVAANCSSLSLLLYPRFYEVAHPILNASLRFGKDGAVARFTDFHNRGNRPILHRKELLVDDTDKWFPVFKRLSNEEANWGLLDTAQRIGNENAWSSVLQAAGVEIDGHRVVRAK